VYRARDAAGNLVQGLLEAESEVAAVALLRRQNYFIVDVAPAPAGTMTVDFSALLGQRVGSGSLAVFCRQLATLVEAGIPLLSALTVLAEQTEERRLRRAVAGLVQHLEGGRGLAEALRFFPRIFPPVMTNMVEAGEVGGVLDRVLERLALHFEREHEMRGKIKAAVTYPAIVVLIAGVVLIILVTFVLPTFMNMLQELSVPLPLPTRFVMGMSMIFRRYWYCVPLLALALAGGLRAVVSSPRGKEWWDRLLLRLPVFGSLFRKIIIARFCRTLGTLFQGGVPILRALDVVKNVTGNTLVTRAVEEAAESIREGAGLAGPFARSGVFPPMVTRMVAVGEETGALDSMLERAAVFYEREVETAVARLASLLEPFLIVGLGGFVGFIVIAILLPYFQMLGSLQ